MSWLRNLMLCCLSSMVIYVINAANGEQSLIVIIRSQPHPHHAQMSQETMGKLLEQVKPNLYRFVHIYQVHEKWPEKNDIAWAILNIFSAIKSSFDTNSSWVMFIEETTRVNLEYLSDFLAGFDPGDDLFLGRGLSDREPTLIHNFASVKAKNDTKTFLYPDFQAGWILSHSLVEKLANHVKAVEWKPEFQIDLQFEIAKVIEEIGVLLTNEPKFCGVNEVSRRCITHSKGLLRSCGKMVDKNDIFVAVKTTEKLHKPRLEVIKKTWAKKIKHITMYSNVTDPYYPTIDSGVPNTERGHCGKMEKILRDFSKKSFDFLLIVDDDTIVSVSRLIKLLGCYDPKDYLLLGDKYGYDLHSGRGYGYIAGGGGIVLTLPSVEKWIENCKCPKLDTTDDIYLGKCLSQKAGIFATHSPLFHQARPQDYPQASLMSQEPISFHKHWMNDPKQIYEYWFEADDRLLETFKHGADEEYEVHEL